MWDMWDTKYVRGKYRLEFRCMREEERSMGSSEGNVTPYVGWGYREGRISRVLDELRTHNEVKVGEAYVVRIPKIPGKIQIDKKGRNTEYVIYIYENWYDKEKKQNRNRKACIGQVLYVFPGAMLPTEKYYQYFDRVTGEEKKRTEETEERVPCDGGTERRVMSEEFTVPRGGAEGTEKTETEENKELNSAKPGTGRTMERPAMNGLNSREQKAAIQRVMEDEGIIRRGPERLREAIRERVEGIQKRMEDGMSGQEQEEDSTGNGTEALERMPAIQMTEEERKRRRRLRVLLDVMSGIRDVVKEQARKRPDEIMNAYQVEKINPVLEEIMRIEKEMGFGDLLETIRKTETGKDGKVEVKGMSYGDIEVLLEYFNSVVWFTQSEML